MEQTYATDRGLPLCQKFFVNMTEKMPHGNEPENFLLVYHWQMSEPSRGGQVNGVGRGISGRKRDRLWCHDVLHGHRARVLTGTDHSSQDITFGEDPDQRRFLPHQYTPVLRLAHDGNGVGGRGFKVDVERRDELEVTDMIGHQPTSESYLFFGKIQACEIGTTPAAQIHALDVVVTAVVTAQLSLPPDGA